MSNFLPKKIVDWELIEQDWRAGIKSVLQIAVENGISHTAINKRFKKLGIPRDLSAKVRAKADSLVSMAMVSAEVSTETTMTDAHIINSNAARLADVQLAHISGSKTLRLKAQSYLHELNSCGENFPKRVSILKLLSDVHKNIVAVERQANGLKDDDDPEKHQFGVNININITPNEAYLRVIDG